MVVKAAQQDQQAKVSMITSTLFLKRIYAGWFNARDSSVIEGASRY